MRNWLMQGMGRILQARRLESRLPLRHVAQRAQLTVRELGRIERGNVDVDLDQLEAVAESLQIELDQLFIAAVAADPERILTVDLSKSSIQELRAGHRDVLVSETFDEAMVLLELWRVDVIVVRHQPSSSFSQRFFRWISDNKRCVKIPICRMVAEPGNELASGEDPFPGQIIPESQLRICVDKLLGQTHKGRVARLRRTRDDCAQTQHRLLETRNRLMKQCERVLQQIDRLKRLHDRFPSFSVHRTHSNTRLDELRQKAVALTLKDKSLRLEAAGAAERSRFLQRNVEWLMRQSYDINNL